MSNLPFSRASENNRHPILAQLRSLLTTPAVVLEIGTGTGQHAEHFASHLPHLHWLPTDHPDMLDACRQRLARANLSNIGTPRPLDVSARPWDDPPFDHAYSANTAHIMSWNEVRDMFSGISGGLPSGGCFCLYGPFNEHGRYTSDSNAQFDQHLKARASHMGIRDLADLEALAEEHGMSLYRKLGMPANNRLLVFRKRAS